MVDRQVEVSDNLAPFGRGAGGGIRPAPLGFLMITPLLPCKILELFRRPDYSWGGRGEGRAGTPANQHPGNPEREELLRTTWLTPPKACRSSPDLGPRKDPGRTPEGPGIQNTGSGECVCVCLEAKVRSHQISRAHQ